MPYLRERERQRWVYAYLMAGRATGGFDEYRYCGVRVKYGSCDGRDRFELNCYWNDWR